MHLRLDGGAAEEEATSSSASLVRFRPPAAGRPRFAADMLGRSGELLSDEYNVIGAALLMRTSLVSDVKS